MRLSGQFQICLFFLGKGFEGKKKAPKRKSNDHHPLKSFCAHKKCCLCCLAFA